MIADILLILALIVLNGVLAMSELAVVSARPARLKSLEARSSGARMALRLAEEPGRFLSTVQIGITAVGILSGALAGDTIGERLAAWLIAEGMDPTWAKRLGVGGVVVAITYVSLIIGELVPKQLALRNPEAVAIRVAPAMTILSKIAAPVVFFLDISGKSILWLLGQRGASEAQVTEEEVHVLLTEAQQGGVLEEEEREMITGVMRLSDRTARNLMTPRQKVEAVLISSPPEEALAQITALGTAAVPVSDAAGDVLGIIRLREVLRAVVAGKAFDIQSMLREVPVVSDQMEALDLVELLQRAEDHMALVYDEYGDFEGIITSRDVLEAITGSVASAKVDEPAIFTREDGSMLVSGWMPADEFCDRMSLPRDLAGDYDTVAGLVLHQLGHMAKLGETLEIRPEGGPNFRIEVLDLDGMRIDKILLREI